MDESGGGEDRVARTRVNIAQIYITMVPGETRRTMVIPQRENEEHDRGRLIAVDDVHIQASPGKTDQMAWFYGELIGLRPTSAADQADSSTLCFRSDQFSLIIELTDDPKIESVACRVRCEVASLDAVIDTLTDRGTEFDHLRGISWTDRCVSLLDPAGNRVHIRHRWNPTM